MPPVVPAAAEPSRPWLGPRIVVRAPTLVAQHRLHAFTRDQAAALIGGHSLLAFPPVSYWSSLYRVDALALALSLGGVYVTVPRPAGRPRVPGAAGLVGARGRPRPSDGLAAPRA